MNNYQFSNSVRTSSGTIVASGLIATQLAAAQAVAQQKEYKRSPTAKAVYSIAGTPATFDQYSNVFTGEYMAGDDLFEDTVTSFYADLLAKQKPLGEQFAKVLHDNLWDLYAR